MKIETILRLVPARGTILQVDKHPLPEGSTMSIDVPGQLPGVHNSLSFHPADLLSEYRLFTHDLFLLYGGFLPVKDGELLLTATEFADPAVDIAASLGIEKGLCLINLDSLVIVARYPDTDRHIYFHRLYGVPVDHADELYRQLNISGVAKPGKVSGTREFGLCTRSEVTVHGQKKFPLTIFSYTGTDFDVQVSPAGWAGTSYTEDGKSIPEVVLPLRATTAPPSEEFKGRLKEMAALMTGRDPEKSLKKKKRRKGRKKN